jgi:multicomponent Na+:H+ antiporter subunit D
MMIEAALVIALPLTACLLAVPLGCRASHLLWPAIPGCTALLILLGMQLRSEGPSVYALGGWEAPLGVVLRVDGLAAAFVALGTLIAGTTGLYSARYFAIASSAREANAFWPLFFATWAASNAIFLTSDLFNTYVALELLTLASVGMVALEGRRENVAAAMRYLLFALMGSLSFLLGVVLLYGSYATLDMGQLGQAVQPTFATVAAAAMITAGLFAKTALFPLHAWLPPAHSGAPAPASALLSALVVTASFYALLRIWFDVFPVLSNEALDVLFGLLGFLAVLLGSVLAFLQRRLKAIIAYSTVAQMGYLLLVFPLAGSGSLGVAADAWSGTAFQALSHGLAKAAMFLAAGTFILSAGDDRLSSLAGIGKSVPVASFAFGLAAVSLMGLPPSGGFLAKYLMLRAALSGGGWCLGMVLVTGGLLAAVYLFRPLNVMVSKRSDDAPPLARVHWTLQLFPLVLALAALLLGIFSIDAYRIVQFGSPFAAFGPMA